MRFAPVATTCLLLACAGLVGCVGSPDDAKLKCNCEVIDGSLSCKGDDADACVDEVLSESADGAVPSDQGKGMIELLSEGPSSASWSLEENKGK